MPPAAHGAEAIDFDSKAAALGPLIERLATQTGAHIRASSKIAQEIVFVHAKGVTLPELKSRIAEAILGTWVKEGDIEYLTRTAGLDRKIWADHVAYRRKLVDEALKEAQKQLDQKFDARSLALGLAALEPEDPNQNDRAAGIRRYEAERSLFGRSALARLTHRLMLACNPNDLAAVGPFERHIFRIQPTRMQKGFDRKKYDAAMAAFTEEQQAWVDEAAKVTFPTQPNGRMVTDPRSQVNIEPKLTGISFEVRRGEMTSLLWVNLTCDNVPPFGYATLNQVMYADPGRKFLDSQLAPKPPAKDDPVVELSEDSKEFQARMLEAFASRQANPLTPRMRGLMLGIEQNDPLSWTVSDGLSAIARMKNVNMVAALPDKALSMAFFVSRERPMRAGQFLDALVGSGTVELQEKDGWALMSPPDRFEAVTEFTPRAPAVALVKSVLSSGRLDIHDYAKYAFQSKLLNRGGLGEWFLAMADRTVLGTSDHTDWKTLQLYGSLSPAQQRALESGGRVLYGGMNPEQAKIVDRIVYGGRLNSGTTAPNGTTTWSGKGVEPTDSYPIRVPPDCAVTAIVQSNPVIVAYGKGSDGRSRPLRGLDVWNLASIEVNVVGDPTMMSQYGVANLAGYGLGTDRILQIHVEPSAGIWAPSTIMVPDYDANATPVPWDKLPDPYPKQIAAAIAQVKAQKANQPGRTIPPR